jgi:hypothetical protein
MKSPACPPAATGSPSAPELRDLGRDGSLEAEEGDFSAAGSINVNYLNVLDRPLIELEGGQNGFARALFAGSSKLGDGQIL